MTQETIGSGTIQAMLHTGNAIWFLSQVLSDPLDAVLEMIQNALDKRATKVLVEIHRHRPARVAVYDNGDGASREEIQQKFENICRSFKGDDPEAIGEKGFGNLAGIAIGKEYYLITKPKRTQQPFFRISLKREDVIDKTNVIIPWEEIGPKANLPPGFFTMVMLKRVDEGIVQVLSDLEGLAEAIANNYSLQIRRRNVEVILKCFGRAGCEATKKVVPQEFPGEKQEVFEVSTDFGPVAFEFYTTLIAQKIPKILVEHKQRFSFPLTRSKLRYMPEACYQVLGSGYLHGYIKLAFGELNASRKDLIYSEERNALVAALETFCLERGLAYIEELRQGEKLDHYEKIIRAAVEPLGQFFKEHPEQLPSIFQGVISQGHKDAQKGVVIPLGFEKLVRIKRPTPSLGSPHKPGPAKRERRMIHVNIQQSQQGQPRLDIQKSQRPRQRGLTIILEEGNIETGLKWRSRISSGWICINISHPDWGRVTDISKTTAIEYVKMLLLKEITQASLGGVQGKFFHENFESVLMPIFMATCTPKA